MTHLTKVKTKLAIHAHRKVSGLLDGQYASVQSGRSLDFADLREYVVGDDVKDIDWKATARHSKPLVKRYVADRKHTVMLAIATGRTMAANATPNEAKSDVALMAAGTIGYLATRHGDYVGLYASRGDSVDAFRPSMREIDVERMLNRAEAMCSLDSPVPDLEALLWFAIGATRRRNIVLLIIDDIDLTPVEEGLLKRMAVQHEVLLVAVGDLDPTDQRLQGRAIRQLDTGRILPLYAESDQLLAREITAARADCRRRRAALCATLGIAYEQVSSCDEVIGTMLRLLERTNHAARR